MVGYSLSKKNLILMGIGFVIILVGFCCMIGGGSEDGISFNPEIFSSRRIVVGPMIALFGFIFEVYAILSNPQKGLFASKGGLVLKKEETKVEEDKALDFVDDTKKLEASKKKLK